MKTVIAVEIEESMLAKMRVMMAFYNCATEGDYISQGVEVDWVAMNELKIADLVMTDYIGHDFGFAEEAK